MLTAKDIMTRDVLLARPQDRVDHILEVLKERKISGLPVVDDQGKLVGIVTINDILKQVARQAPRYYGLFGVFVTTEVITEDESFEEKVAHLGEMQVGQIMTRRVLIVHEDTPIDEVARLLMARAIKRVPVVSHGRVVGVVSRGDLVNVLGNKQ